MRAGHVLLLDADDPRRGGEGVVDRDAWRRGPGGPVGHRGRDARKRGSATSPTAARDCVGRGASSTGLPSGGLVVGKQPVEERLHGVAEYSRAPALVPWRVVMKSAICSENGRVVHSLFSICGKCVHPGPRERAQFAGVVESAVSHKLSPYEADSPTQGSLTSRAVGVRLAPPGATRQKCCKSARSSNRVTAAPERVKRSRRARTRLSTAIVSLKAWEKGVIHIIHRFRVNHGTTR